MLPATYERVSLRSLAISRAASACCAGLTFAAAVISILGWILDRPGLYAWDGSGINIKFNAALSLCLASLALLVLCLLPRLTPVVRFLAAAAAVITITTLAEHITGVDLHIDVLFMHEPPGARATSAPGRMGMPASAAISLIAIAILLRSWKVDARLVSLLGTLALLISLLSLTGYAFGADQLYAIPKYTGIALQTAWMVASDRKSTRLNSSHTDISRMPSSA